MTINTKWFQCYVYKWGFWFRLFGYGLNVNNNPPLFSQRNGYTKMIKIGKIKIILIRREK